MHELTTRHAAVRIQQRGISAEALDFLLAYGTCARSRGADTVFFNSKTRQWARAEFEPCEFRKMERFMDIYVVVSDDGRAITAAWRRQRLRRP